MAIDLTNRVCLITGAGRGIGQSVARGFAARGAIVVATDIRPPTDDDFALALAWDVSDPEQATLIVERVVAEFGRLDAFIANAGINPSHAWDQLTFDDWRRELVVNLDGAWAGMHAVSRVMVKQGYGKIVAVSSVQVRLGPDRHIPYAAAKAGLLGLTRSLARALGPHGVRVNAILPGAVRTPAELELYPDQETLARQLAARQCLPDRLLPESIEPVFAFLCSSESDAITGQAVCADHGLIHW